MPAAAALVSSSSSSPTAYAADGSALFRSTDAGSTWTSLGSPTGAAINAVLVDPANPNDVYIGTATGVSRSIDGGLTWTPGFGLPTGSFVALAGENGHLYASSGATLYQSLDGGNTWLSLGSPTGSAINAVLVDPANPNDVFIGTATGVSRSIDGGLTWTPGLGLPTGSFVALAGENGHLYASSGATLYQSLDGGNTWLSLGSPTGSAINAVLVDPANPNDVFIGTATGVSQSIDGGFAWTPSSGIAAGVQSLSVVQTSELAGSGDLLYRSTDRGATWHLVADLAPRDTTPPVCALTGRVFYPSSTVIYQIQVTVQDSGSGISSITETHSNAIASPPGTTNYSPATTSAVVVTATKVDPSSGSSLKLVVTDAAGNQTTCDPVFNRASGTHPVAHPRPFPRREPGAGRRRKT